MLTYLEVGEGGGHADDLDGVSGGVEDLGEEELEEVATGGVPEHVQLGAEVQDTNTGTTMQLPAEPHLLHDHAGEGVQLPLLLQPVHQPVRLLNGGHSDVSHLQPAGGGGAGHEALHPDAGVPEDALEVEHLLPGQRHKVKGQDEQRLLAALEHALRRENTSVRPLQT